MADYRRYFVAGGTFFFTIVTYQRRPIFFDDKNVDLLRTVVADVRRELPFEINAAVVLPDHLHFIWSLPPGDANFSKRIGRMKASFTKLLRGSNALPATLSDSRRKHRESDVWQRRFWEHTVRDEDEFARLFDYIHFNPVKHGHTSCPHKWKASSFHHWVKRGVMGKNWGCSCDGRNSVVKCDDVDDVVGE
jgi:putative transposase